MLDKYWSTYPRRGFHPDDESQIPLEKLINWDSKEGIAKTKLLKSDKSLQKKLHKNLFAIPYMGNLALAKVFILFGNPGVGRKSYKCEYSKEYLIQLLIENLNGQSKIFMDLDPMLQRNGGSKYWPRVFKRLAEKIADIKHIDMEESYDLIAKGVAVLEACAYRSYRSPDKWTDELASSKMIQTYVHQALVPRAEAGEILLFVWRRADFWKVESRSNHIIIRNPKIAQLKYLLKPERRAIREMLLSNLQP